MTDHDIGGAMELKRLPNWNQTEADWRMLLAAGEGRCFVAIADRRVVGTITSTPYGCDVAWIGMVLVHPDYRRRGIATRLMHRAIDSLSDIETIKLDATPAGACVYEKLGFVEEYRLIRFVAERISFEVTQTCRSEPLTAGNLAAAERLDTEAFGVSRSGILRSLFERAPDGAYSVTQDDALRGFCLGRPGETFWQIGPVTALSTDDAVAVTRGALAQQKEPPVVIDVPVRHGEYIDFLQRIGFHEQRPYVRMFRGPNQAPGRLDWQFAIAGAEIG